MSKKGKKNKNKQKNLKTIKNKNFFILKMNIMIKMSKTIFHFRKKVVKKQKKTLIKKII